MNKMEFLESLAARLKGINKKEISERVEFYSEAIDDRIEEGDSEEEATLAMGSVDNIAAQIRKEVLQSRKERKSAKRRKMRAWEIVLLAVGSPVWISILVAALAVIFAVYVSVWSVVISLWAVFASLVGGAFGGIAGSIIIIATGNASSGVALFGLSIICAGLSIFMFFCCMGTTKGMIKLTKSMLAVIKNAFTRRRADNE